MDNINKYNCDLSICIPCHNLENYIARCINSILRQDFNGYKSEIIFICDYCTDNTFNIINNIMGKVGIPYIVEEQKYKSCGWARNRALELSTGKYIQFIDGDDYLLGTDVYLKLIPLMEKYDVVRFGYIADFRRERAGWEVWSFLFSRKIIGDIRFRNDTDKKEELAVLEDKNFRDEVFEKNPSVAVG